MITTPKQELLSNLENIKGKSFLVIGDIILDRYIWGAVDRISPEAPVPVVDVKQMEDRLGGAGLVVRNLVALGANVSLCGFVGDDDEGKTIISQLVERKVNREGVIVDRDRPTSLKTRVIAHAQQVVRIDREVGRRPSVALSEALAAVVDSQIDKHQGIIVSDYGKGSISEAVLKKLERARADGRTSISKRPLLLDPHPKNYGFYRGLSIVKPNRREAERATGMIIDSDESAEKAARKLLSDWDADVVMITRSEDPVVMVCKDHSGMTLIPTISREVFDVTGAGDTAAALFIAALTAGATLTAAAEFANIGSGMVVAEIGTVSIDTPKLRQEIERLGGK